MFSTILTLGRQGAFAEKNVRQGAFAGKMDSYQMIKYNKNILPHKVAIYFLGYWGKKWVGRWRTNKQNFIFSLNKSSVHFFLFLACFSHEICKSSPIYNTVILGYDLYDFVLDATCKVLRF